MSDDIGNDKTKRKTQPMDWMRRQALTWLSAFLARPVQRYTPVSAPDLEALSNVLQTGDVILSGGNSRFAALIKHFTRSTWSHVSMYVGPLHDGPDAPCIVEADIAAGVRAVHLSELAHMQVRVLRPVLMSDLERRQLADWVIGRIGGDYDFEHALRLGRGLVNIPLIPKASRQPVHVQENSSMTRFICSSLLARAFALAGYPIMVVASVGRIDADAANLLMPCDFERSPIFEVINVRATR